MRGERRYKHSRAVEEKRRRGEERAGEERGDISIAEQ